MLGIMVKETDGHNAYDRFSSVDLQQLAKDQMAQADYYKHSLLTAIQPANTPTMPSRVSVFAPSYDPVTG